MSTEHTGKKPKLDYVVEQLRGEILKGELTPGNWLRQDDIAARFGVSSTPVREAFGRLEAEGLVERIPHQGVRVVAYTLDVAKEYFDLRLMIEPYAVERATSRLTEEELNRLGQLLEEARDLQRKGALAELNSVNWSFHTLLVNRCGSRLVCDVLARIWRSFQLDTLLLIPQRASDSILEHEAILKALRNRDGVEAATAMRVNIENARAAVLSSMPALAGK